LVRSGFVSSFWEEFGRTVMPFVVSLVAFVGLILIVAVIFSLLFLGLVITLQARKVYTMPVNHIPMLMLCISPVS